MLRIVMTNRLLMAAMYLTALILQMEVRNLVVLLSDVLGHVWTNKKMSWQLLQALLQVSERCKLLWKQRKYLLCIVILSMGDSIRCN